MADWCERCHTFHDGVDCPDRASAPAVSPMRASSTLLEAYRLWRDPEQDWFTEAALEAQIRGEFRSNREIAIGLAFGDILREPATFRIAGGYRSKVLHWFDDAGGPASGAFCFDDATMAAPLELTQIPGAVFEAKAHQRYEDVVVPSKADQLIGGVLREFKTTASFVVDKYLASYQWRFMADAFQPAYVEYLVFPVDDHENGVVGLKPAQTFRVYPYPELSADCARLVAEFREYLVWKGLDGELRAQQQKWGARGVSGLTA